MFQGLPIYPSPKFHNEDFAMCALASYPSIHTSVYLTFRYTSKHSVDLCIFIPKPVSTILFSGIWDIHTHTHTQGFWRKIYILRNALLVRVLFVSLDKCVPPPPKQDTQHYHRLKKSCWASSPQTLPHLLWQQPWFYSHHRLVLPVQGLA